MGVGEGWGCGGVGVGWGWSAEGGEDVILEARSPRALERNILTLARYRQY